MPLPLRAALDGRVQELSVGIRIEGRRLGSPEKSFVSALTQAESIGTQKEAVEHSIRFSKKKVGSFWWLTFDLRGLAPAAEAAF